ncbi:tRNA (N(6)-L-threonylcarbamoyladenosine(37)-C(2))-methylthiotransferase [Candidatus Bathyarchaeota archaeon]|nr:tRNA (N(6)-L-threonylcarbamoyladenosine(37)-C(2))-methylthiotransferase [Candidatus Bathyarchaeota archaeon]
MEEPRSAENMRAEPFLKGGMNSECKSYYYESYGCASNRGDTEIMLAILDQSGYLQASDPDGASVILINTCAVKGVTEGRMLGRLRELGRYGKPVIVAGCLPSIALPRIVDVLPDYAALVNPTSVEKILEAAEESLRGRLGLRFSGRPRDKSLLPRKRMNRFIEIVPISEGCLGSCTYCCTRFARGRLFSFSPEGILCQVRRAVDEGVAEIQITAQDTASYWADGIDLAELLRRIVAIPGDFKVRVGMMNPERAHRIVEDLMDIYEDPKIYRFLHLPVQSGSDMILESMNRGYTVADFTRIVDLFRSRFQTISIATDVIVGYPGEGEEQFLQTEGLLRRVRPDVVNISKYTPRPGTVASRLKPLDGRVVSSRSRRLVEVASRIVLEQNLRMVGSIQEISAIEIGRGGGVFGRTENYKKTLAGGRENFGKRLKIRITGAHSRYLEAEILGSRSMSATCHGQVMGYGLSSS